MSRKTSWREKNRQFFAKKNFKAKKRKNHFCGFIFSFSSYSYSIVAVLLSYLHLPIVGLPSIFLLCLFLLSLLYCFQTTIFLILGRLLSFISAHLTPYLLYSFQITTFILLGLILTESLYTSNTFFFSFALLLLLLAIFVFRSNHHQHIFTLSQSFSPDVFFLCPSALLTYLVLSTFLFFYLCSFLKITVAIFLNL